MNTETIDTTNKQLVGAGGDGIVFVLPVPRTMTKQEALVFAAWIVAIADEEDNFQSILSEVQNT